MAWRERERERDTGTYKQIEKSRTAVREKDIAGERRRETVTER